MQRDTSGETSPEYTERVTVAEATERLGISGHAIRQRIKRGTLASEKDEEGRVWVFVPPSTAETSGEASAEASPESTGLLSEKDARIADLQAQLAAEREANRENRRIIMQQAQSIAAIEPAREPPERPEGPEPEREAAAPESATQPPERPGFWRRLFGGG